MVLTGTSVGLFPFPHPQPCSYFLGFSTIVDDGNEVLDICMQRDHREIENTFWYPTDAQVDDQVLVPLSKNCTTWGALKVSVSSTVD